MTYYQLRPLRAGVAVVLCQLIASVASFAILGFGSPDALNTNAGSDSGSDEQVDLATDGTGHWVAVWMSDENVGGSIETDFDIFMSRSSDNGGSWTVPAVLNINAATDSGGDIGPRIVTDGLGTWLAVWYSDDALGGTVGTDTDVFLLRSMDNGATWSAPTALNTNAGSDTGSEISVSLATDKAGHWVCAWVSTENLGETIGTDFDVLVSRSSNNGTIWSAPAALNSSASSDGDSGDVQPDIQTDGNGVWVTVWDSRGFTGIKDIAVSRSLDNGATWSAMAPLEVETLGENNGDEHPSVATDREGNWIVAWMNHVILSAAHSADGGVTWGNPEPVDSRLGQFPKVVNDGFGNWVVVYHRTDTEESDTGTDYDIFVSTSADNGGAWTPSGALSANATTDSGTDSQARTVTDGKGNWIAAWESTDTLGGTVGTDTDIFVVTSSVASGDGLRIISPNGGEKLKIGKRFTIEWASVGDPGDEVELGLFRSGSFVTSINGSTPNDGTQRWRVPSGLATGKGYKVRVRSATDTSIGDLSDAPFRIKPAK